MGAENRKYPRAPLLATAVLHKGTRPIGSFRVVNASAGGLLLAGQAPEGMDRVEVLLRLPLDRLVRGEAVVVRQEVQNGRPAFALSFPGLRPDQERVIQEAVLAAFEESRTAAILVLEEDVELSQALREAIGRFGYRSFPVASVLELVHALERPNSFRMAFVEERLSCRAGGWANGSEVLDYLAAQHSDVQRVLMVDGADPQFRQESLPQDRVHHVLVKPWTDSKLAGTLGYSPTVEVKTLPDE
jgi:hypothetical protein